MNIRGILRMAACREEPGSDWQSGVLRACPSERVDARMVELGKLCADSDSSEDLRNRRAPRGSLKPARLAETAARMRARRAS